MTETRWWKYLQQLMGDQTQLEAAKFIGISKSNITRWKDGARAAPDFVVKVARAYNANVLEALVEAEFITEEEANLREIKIGGIALTDATDEQLTKELLRRLKLLDTRPIDQVDELSARRRSNISTPDVDHDPYADGAVPNWDEVADLPHAADSSPNEQTEREKRGEDLID